MAEKSKKPVKSALAIDPNEGELNSLFKEVLDGLRDDLIEAQQNADLYYEDILNSAQGREMFGNAYNDALKIKQSARDKTLKFLGLFKERVGKKEDVELKQKQTATGASPIISHDAMNKMLEEMKQSGGLSNIDLTQISFDDDEYDEGEDGEDDGN